MDDGFELPVRYRRVLISTEDLEGIKNIDAELLKAIGAAIEKILRYDRP